MTTLSGMRAPFYVHLFLYLSRVFQAARYLALRGKTLSRF